MKTTTESEFPFYDHTIGLTSAMIGNAYNDLRHRAVKMELELRAIASNDQTPDRIKINIHNAIK
jgi:hypothetical protein